MTFLTAYDACVFPAPHSWRLGGQPQGVPPNVAILWPVLPAGKVILEGPLQTPTKRTLAFCQPGSQFSEYPQAPKTFDTSF